MNKEQAEKEILQLLALQRTTSRLNLDHNGYYLQVEEMGNSYQFQLPPNTLSSQQSR